MSNLSMILSGIMMMALVVFFAPNIFALNRGHILRNLALWLAIFLGLAVFYQNFGPESPHPLFALPPSMAGIKPVSLDAVEQPAPDKDNKTPSEDGSQGYTPPKE